MVKRGVDETMERTGDESGVDSWREGRIGPRYDVFCCLFSNVIQVILSRYLLRWRWLVELLWLPFLWYTLRVCLVYIEKCHTCFITCLAVQMIGCSDYKQIFSILCHHLHIYLLHQSITTNYYIYTCVYLYTHMYIYIYIYVCIYSLSHEIYIHSLRGRAPDV
uniref:Uncharacterized protein n=1 Tax=Octopus bimaculoides TaxID=37653 RepID=A0A0L8HG01_OCTBM